MDLIAAFLECFIELALVGVESPLAALVCLLVILVAVALLYWLGQPMAIRAVLDFVAGAWAQRVV